MKRNFFLGLLPLILLLPCTRSMGQEAVSWYRHFSATIDKYPITIHLHKAGQDYSGFYYYEKTQRPFFLMGNSGDSSRGPGKIRLTAFIPGNESNSELLTITVDGDSLTGEWQREGDALSLPLTGVAVKMDSLNFGMVYVEGSIKLRPTMENTPAGSYSAASVWPLENTPLASYLKRLINGLLGHKNNGEEIGRFLLLQKKKFLDSYLKDNRELADSEIVSSPTAFSLDEDQHLLVLYHSTRLLALSNWNYSYSGGAHGNYGTVYTTVDLLRKKKLQLPDVLNPAGIIQLRVLAEKYFRKEFKLKDGADLTEAGLFENKIKPTNNFFLTAKGIGLSYMPYEIGPYAMGEITIFIPFTELDRFINPGFRKLVE